MQSMKHQAFGDDAMTDKTSKPEAPPAQPAELKDDKLDAVVGAGQTSNFSDGAQSYGLPLTDMNKTISVTSISNGVSAAMK